MITIKNGNLLVNSDQLTVICHQVNCQGKMASGVAKSIRTQYPKVYECYRDLFTDDSYDPFELLGGTLKVPIDDNFSVINMFSQLNYGYDGKRYTSYDAFYSCLEQIKKMTTEKDLIGFPYGIGCVRGGASWSVILAMMEDVLKDRNVIIYKYEEDYKCIK